MGKYMDLEIDNRRKSAIPMRKAKITGQWKDPGAKLYNQLLNAQHVVGNKVPDDPKEFAQLIKDGKCTTWQTYLKEAYMVAPVDDIKNSPYGVTPFSRSGCKYPHHVIKNGKLVVSIPGLRAAYMTARNNGVLVNHTPENKKIVAHFNRHFKELGLRPVWRGEFYLIDESVEKIERNFQSIYEFIDRSLGTNIVAEIDHLGEYFGEASHSRLKYEYRMGIDIKTGRQVAVQFILDPNRITSVGNRDAYEVAHLLNNPQDLSMARKVDNRIDELNKLGDSTTADELKAKLDSKMDNLTKGARLNALDVVKKNIAKTGHIDHITDELLVDKIFFRNGQSVRSIEIVPTLSDEVKRFTTYLENTYEMDQFRVKNPASYYHDSGYHFSQMHMFDNKAIQAEFVKWCQNNNVHGETYTVGTMGGKGKYKTTKLSWNILTDSMKFTKSPSVRGKLTPYRITKNDKEYTGYNKPTYSYESADSCDEIKELDGSSLDDKYLVSWLGKEIGTNLSLFNDPIYVKYGLVINGHIEFVLFFFKEDTFNYIQAFYGNPDCRGKGYGQRLLKHVLNEYPDKEFRIDPHRNNKRAIHIYKKLGFEEIQPWYVTGDKEVDSSYIKNQLPMARLPEEKTESAMSDEAIVLNSKTLDEIGRTPETIYEWMHENIEYDDEVDNWKLRSPSEVYLDRKGNSHDQSLFVALHLHSLNIVNGTLFFAGFNKDGSIVGRTHTLVWFREGGNGYCDFKEPFDDSKKYNGSYEYYWFENAWESQSGIHGPYSNLAELKAAVFLNYKNDPDADLNECEGIVFSDHGNHRVGMTMREYNKSWRFDDRMRYYMDMSKTINEFYVSVSEFMDSDQISEITEKSHGALKYCYRIGFDVNTGKEVAIEFILDPDTITKVGDITNIKNASIKSNTKVNVLNVAEDAIDIAKKNVRKYGHIDFTTDALRVHRIFFRGGESINSVEFIPMFSKEVTASMNKVARFAKLPKGTSSLDVFNHKEFPGILQREIQSNHTAIERYKVGEMSGKDKYKTTKLMWDHDLFLSYKYTPVLRGVNGKGRYVHNKPEDINDLKEYLKKNLNNRYSESYMDDINIVDSIFNESNFQGLTTIGVNIPYDIGYGYSSDEPIDYIYTEAITFDEESMDNGNIDSALIMEDGDVPAEPPSIDNEQAGQSEPKKESLPKQTDRAESDKNGVRRKKLYIAFIEWCKAYNNKNTFGSIFDKDAFKITYPFVPDEMRYFYRLANPILCVLSGNLTFFQVSELRKLNQSNHRMNEMLIFAATPNDMRVFNIKDKKVYRGTEENGQIKLNEVLGNTFDTYIQKMIDQGDILNGPIEESFQEY